MKTRYTYRTNMKGHVTFFIFMMLLMSVILFKRVTAGAIHSSCKTQMPASRIAMDINNSSQSIF